MSITVTLKTSVRDATLMIEALREAAGLATERAREDNNRALRNDLRARALRLTEMADKLESGS